MIDASADAYRIFFEQTKIGCRLTRVKYARLVFLEPVDILPGEGGNAAHALHTVEDKPFALKNGMYGSFGDKRFFPIPHGIAILLVGGKTRGRLFYLQDLF